jgi:gamma-glutamylputrescine oxidase
MLKNTNWSYWERENYVEDIDFLIIGAGIVGYSTALGLHEKHPEARIIILERGNLSSGASSKNAGFACFGSVTEVYDDIQQFGEEEVWNTVALRWKGLQVLRSFIGDETLDLQINGSWDLITKEELSIFDASRPYIKEYNERLESITGQKDVYSIDNEAADRFGFGQVETSFYNRLEGQIDTGRMNQAFYKKAVSAGIRILFGTEVLEIQEGEDHAIAKTVIGDFTSKKIAVCTNGFAQELINEEVEPARAQVLITKPIPNLHVKGTFHYQQGYYYFRNIHDRILFGGGRHLDKQGENTSKMEISEKIMGSLEEILRSVILPSTPVEIDYRWAGIMGVGSAKKPIIKQISPSIYCGVRLGGMGVAIGSLIGKEIVALMTDES